ncbi:MAG: RpiB/LacA/LacB family sugar-phosphate isomerase [Bacilli bacterium]|nr:RpiB/LacA/LacB family sugar-phosphate isomerase [Bacilli bacterium]
MKIAIASDHRGINYKKEIIDYLLTNNYEVIDCSKVNYKTDDYPDFAFKVCNEVINKNADFGILVCRTGIGMSIAANKVKGIRCAKVDSVEEAILCRNDNGANVITFNYTKDFEEIKKIIDAYINAEELNDERHIRRINKIMDYERGAYNEL